MTDRVSPFILALAASPDLSCVLPAVHSYLPAVKQNRDLRECRDIEANSVREMSA